MSLSNRGSRVVPAILVGALVLAALTLVTVRHISADERGDEASVIGISRGATSTGRATINSPEPSAEAVLLPRRVNDSHDSQSALPDFHTPADSGPDAGFLVLRKHFVVDRRGDAGTRRVFPAPVDIDYVRQLHHGIYECRGVLPPSAAADGGGDDHARAATGTRVTFAFKTECRPASKWHGQQGYTEVLVNWVVSRLFGDFAIGPFVPGAVGGIVRLPSALAYKIHRDGCGYLTREQEAAMFPDHAAAAAAAAAGEGSRLMIGAMLQWKPRHNDNALPGHAVLVPFRRVAAGAAAGQPPSWKLPALQLGTKVATTTLQMSDIFTVDYIVGNEDRLEKNWFHDDAGRFILMDNGWALAGLDYAGSVCDADETNLRCPPLFRNLAGRGCTGGAVEFCRFRRVTVDRVTDMAESLLERRGSDDGAGGGARDFDDAVSRDPLVAYLDEFYGGVVAKKTRHWSTALARFVDGCDHRSTKKANVKAAFPSLVEMIRFGLSVRLQRVVRHVEGCVARYGKDAVLFG